MTGRRIACRNTIYGLYLVVLNSLVDTVSETSKHFLTYEKDYTSFENPPAFHIFNQCFNLLSHTIFARVILVNVVCSQRLTEVLFTRQLIRPVSDDEPLEIRGSVESVEKHLKALFHCPDYLTSSYSFRLLSLL